MEDHEHHGHPSKPIKTETVGVQVSSRFPLRSFEKLRLLNPRLKTGAVPVPCTEDGQPLPVISFQISERGKLLQFGQQLNSGFIVLWLFHFHEGFDHRFELR